MASTHTLQRKTRLRAQPSLGIRVVQIVEPGRLLRLVAKFAAGYLGNAQMAPNILAAMQLQLQTAAVLILAAQDSRTGILRGYLWGHMAGETFMIQHILAERRGVAKMLLDAAEAWAKRRKATTLTGVVMSSKDTPAYRRLAARYGFAPSATVYSRAVR